MERLRLQKDFKRAYEQGTLFRSRSFTLFFLREGEPGSKVGIVTGKKLGKSVVRNRVRRRIREIIRGATHEWVSGLSLVIVMKEAAARARFESLRQEFIEAARKAGLVHD